MQLNELRKDLQFNTDLLNLIETLKNVAAAQYHSVEKQKERFDRFMDAFSGFFRVVNLVNVDAPLVRAVTDVMGVIVVTSDSGFMGGLNQGVIRAALKAGGDLPEEKVFPVVIGDKGQSVFQDMGRVFKHFPGIASETIYEQAVEIKDYIMREVLAGRIGKVVVAYPRALSFSAQSIEVVNLLPCAELFDIEADSEVAERVSDKSVLADARKVIVESSFTDMVEYLSGVWVTSKLYEVFEDSKLAEVSSRAVHLEGSIQKVEKEHAKVKHKVFKAVHEQIDKGMRESFSGRMIRERKRRKKALQQTRARLAAETAGTGPGGEILND